MHHSEASDASFVRLQNAYDTLMDPGRRREYDRQLPQQTHQEPKIPRPRTEMPNTFGRQTNSFRSGPNQTDPFRSRRAQQDEFKEELVHYRRVLQELWVRVQQSAPGLFSIVPMYGEFAELRQVIPMMLDGEMGWESIMAILGDESRGQSINAIVRSQEYLAHFQEPSKLTTFILGKAFIELYCTVYALQMIKNDGALHKLLWQDGLARHKACIELLIQVLYDAGTISWPWISTQFFT